LPKRLIAKYGLTEAVVIKEVEGGILLEPPANTKLSWEDTYHAMSTAGENWSDWVEVDADIDEDQ
jgi:hypothetical protein